MLGEIVFGLSVLASAIVAIAIELYVTKKIRNVTTQLNHNNY